MLLKQVNILAVQAQKKPGGAGVKLFQAIKDVNQGCSVTLPLPELTAFFLLTNYVHDVKIIIYRIAIFISEILLL